MPAYPPPLRQVLARIQQLAPVYVEDYANDGEWLYLESEDLWDHDLFNRLHDAWPRLVAPFTQRFALIHCEGGEDWGVWLHYLGSQEACATYLPGCHRIPSWV